MTVYCYCSRCLRDFGTVQHEDEGYADVFERDNQGTFRRQDVCLFWCQTLDINWSTNVLVLLLGQQLVIVSDSGKIACNVILDSYGLFFHEYDRYLCIHLFIFRGLFICNMRADFLLSLYFIITYRTYGVSFTYCWMVAYNKAQVAGDIIHTASEYSFCSMLWTWVGLVGTASFVSAGQQAHPWSSSRMSHVATQLPKHLTNWIQDNGLLNSFGFMLMIKLCFLDSCATVVLPGAL